MDTTQIVQLLLGLADLQGTTIAVVRSGLAVPYSPRVLDGGRIRPREVEAMADAVVELEAATTVAGVRTATRQALSTLLDVLISREGATAAITAARERMGGGE
jgi:hypothetical protein